MLHHKPAKITPETVQRLCDREMSLAQIARHGKVPVHILYEITKRHPVTLYRPADPFEVARLFNDGISRKMIAHRLGVSIDTVSNRLQEIGIPKNAKTPKLLPGIDVVEELIKGGFKQTSIGRMYGVSQARVSRLLKYHREKKEPQ
ncbi:hypothetical protein TA3x_004251 [Tundrisphaera sp. TA3]|uniref:hypothetical protein n=1 Tax=Tundrisphaera sp. TA3 TaxID=3435775 RepID=UPI003EB6B9C4